MVASVRQLCAFAAVAAAAVSGSAKAATCTASQTSTLTSALNEYGTDLSDYCAVELCTTNCMNVMTELASSIDDCVYVDGINYYDTLVTALASCATVSDGSASTGGDADTTTTTSSSSSSECSASEMSSTETYVTMYSDSVTTNCEVDTCSSDCISAVAELAALLPDCVYSDGTNYYETVVSITSACSSVSDGSEGSLSTSSGSSCTSSQISETDTVLEDISSAYTASCSDDVCATACESVLTTLSEELPNCVYYDGTNYYASVLIIMEGCGMSTSDSTTTTSTTSSGSSESGSTPSLKRTISPSTDSSTASSSNGASSIAVVSLSSFALVAAVAFAEL